MFNKYLKGSNLETDTNSVLLLTLNTELFGSSSSMSAATRAVPVSAMSSPFRLSALYSTCEYNILSIPIFLNLTHFIIFIFGENLHQELDKSSCTEIR